MESDVHVEGSCAKSNLSTGVIDINIGTNNDDNSNNNDNIHNSSF